MDTKLLRATLYEGSSIPGTGQSWADMAPIAGPALDTLAAAFNSGFRMQDAQGGFYADGVTAVPLVAGAASLVINSDGTATSVRGARRSPCRPRWWRSARTST